MKIGDQRRRHLHLIRRRFYQTLLLVASATAIGPRTLATGSNPPAVAVFWARGYDLQTHTLDRRTGDAHDLTGAVAEDVRASGMRAGLVTVFVVGSTAAMTTIEFEPGAVADFNRLFDELAPRHAEYRHHLRWGDDNGSSHVRAALLGPSLTVPFEATDSAPRYLAADHAPRVRYEPKAAGDRRPGGG